jgi:hypothetical protein
VGHRASNRLLDAARRGSDVGEQQEGTDAAQARIGAQVFELEARLPRHAGEIPPAAVEYLARQVKVEPGMLSGYRFSGRTFEYHRAQGRGALGFREATVADVEALSARMAEEVCPVQLHEERLREALLPFFLGRDTGRSRTVERYLIWRASLMKT